MMFDPKINLLFPILALFVIPIFLKNASANLLGAYNPPPPEKIDVRRTLGSGSRSNCSSSWENDSLILLVPEAETVNYTASNSPSFYFYARESSTVPLIFNLVDPEPNADNPLVEQNLLVNNSGIQKVELPKQVKLEMGKVYLWQLGIRCGDNPEQIAQVIKAAVKQLPLPSQTTSQLQTSDDPIEKARIYAGHGIWYDALTMVRQSQDSDSDTYLRQLLESAELEIQD